MKSVLLFLVLNFSIHAEEDSSAELTGVVTLGDVLANSLLNSPDLQAFSFDVRKAEARIITAKLRKNPVLKIGIEELRINEGPSFTKTKFGYGDITDRSKWKASSETTPGAPAGLTEAEYKIRLSQTIELGKKRMKRVAVARKDLEVIEMDYEVKRMAVLTEAAQKFYQVQASQNLVQLAQDYVTGTPGDVKAAAALKSAEEKLEDARYELATVWGSLSPSFEAVTGDFYEIAEPESLIMLQEAVVKSPALERWELELAKREAKLVLEKANRIPDITIEAGLEIQSRDLKEVTGYELDSSKKMGMNWSKTTTNDKSDVNIDIMVSIPLPIFDRNQGKIKEAQYDIQKSTFEKKSAAVKIGNQVRKVHGSLMKSYEKIQKIVTEPKSSDPTQVYASNTSLVQELAAYHQLFAELERLAGRSAELGGGDLEI